MIANYHTHTWRCNHAKGTEEEYIQVALSRGMKILGFSDHAPYWFPGDYYSYFRMTMEQMEDYIQTVLALREKYRGQIQLPLGFEMEYYPDFFPKTLEIFRDRPIDYLILGQHFLGNEIGEKYGAAPTAEKDDLKRYCRQSMEALNTGLFTYFAHPDLMNFLGDRKFYAEQVGVLCREAKSIGIPLEINLLGLRENRSYPNHLFWEVAAETGNQVILGCDAHHAGALDDPLTEAIALRMAEKLGLEVLDTVQIRSIR